MECFEEVNKIANILVRLLCLQTTMTKTLEAELWPKTNSDYAAKRQKQSYVQTMSSDR